jgi:L-malate glycosyltransferase
MRVLWITAQGGTPSSVRPDAELVLGLARAGFQMHVMARGDSPFTAAIRSAGLPHTEFQAPRGLGRATSAAIREYCTRERIELVQLSDPVALGAALPALRDLPVRLVARHDRTGGVQRWNPLARLTLLQPRLDQVICTSQAAAAQLARRRRPASVVTIPPGHELSWYEQPPAKLLKVGVPPGAFAVGVMTNYRPRKGIEYVIDAAAWLPPGACIHFLLVGAGHDTRSVFERIARSPFRENFHVLGHRDDAPQLVAACAVSVRGALRREGLPQSVIESMACGVPPIVTNAGGAPELVVQGESGIIVRRRSAREIGGALRWLYEHPVERIAMGRAARERIARDFTLARAVEAHAGLYLELGAPPGTDPGEGL